MDCLLYAPLPTIHTKVGKLEKPGDLRKPRSHFMCLVLSPSPYIPHINFYLPFSSPDTTHETHPKSTSDCGIGQEGRRSAVLRKMGKVFWVTLICIYFLSQT